MDSPYAVLLFMAVAEAYGYANPKPDEDRFGRDDDVEGCHQRASSVVKQLHPTPESGVFGPLPCSIWPDVVCRLQNLP